MVEIEYSKIPAQDHKQVHIALDLDGTLAHYETWDKQGNEMGKPIKSMVEKVKQWLKKDYRVSIFTARLTHGALESERQISIIQKFLKENGLPDNLQITPIKFHYFTHIIDDKAFHVVFNTGHIEGKTGL